VGHYIAINHGRTEKLMWIILKLILKILVEPGVD
jgi:hypothetical protein